MSEERLEIVVINDDEVDLASMGEVQGLERQEGEAVEEQLGILGAVVLIGAALAIGRFVQSVIRDIRGGLQINLDKKPPVIRRNGEIPAGWVVAVAADGTVKIETHDEPEDAIERMTTAILKLPVDATVSAVEAAIKAAHPDAKTETPAPAQAAIATP